jgi:predicted MFS family arabinose efflux permease
LDTAVAAPEAAQSARQQRLLWALGTAVFMVNLDARVVAPLLPTLADELHISLPRAGWLVSSYMLPYGFFQLMFGPLADRFGKLAVCTSAMVAFSVGTACTAVWPTFAAIVTMRALTGGAAAGLIPLTLAYVGDTVPYARRQATIATLMASVGASQALSTSLGGTIARLWSWHAVFPVMGLLAAISTAWLYVASQRERAQHVASGARPSYSAVLQTRGLPPLLGLVAVEGFLFMGGFSYLSGLLEQHFGLDALEIGLVLSLAGVAQLLAARLLPRLLRRHPERRLLATGGSLLGFGYAACAFAPHWLLVAIGCLLIGSGFILCHTTLQTRATEAVPEARGTAVALFAFSLFLGGGTGTALLGAALERSGFQSLFIGVSAALFVFTVVVVRVLGNAQRPPRP